MENKIPTYIRELINNAGTVNPLLLAQALENAYSHIGELRELCRIALSHIPPSGLIVSEFQPYREQIKALHPEQWSTSIQKCRLCGHKQVSVHPTVAGEDNFECAKCGNMTADISTDPDDIAEVNSDGD